MLAAWSAVAAANVAVAVYLSLHPGWLRDIWMVRDWIFHWRAIGDPYPAFQSLDYPPNALLLFWPLSIPSDAIIPYVLAGILASAMAATALFLARWLAEQLSIELSGLEQAALVAMVMSKGSIRTAIWLGNTAPIVLMLGALALYWCRRRPLAAMIALALCAAKPHVAIGFGLAMIVLGRAPLVVGAMAIALAKSAVFAMMVGTPLTTLFVTYVQNLAVIYSGPDSINGLLSIEIVVENLVGLQLDAYVLIALACATLALILAYARQPRDHVATAKLAAACLLWSLAFLPHQTYHGVMTAPAIWLLMFRASMLSPAWRLTALVSIAVITVADLPRLIRLWAQQTGDSSLFYNSYFLRPLMVAALLALLLWAATSRMRRRGGDEVQTA